MAFSRLKIFWSTEIVVAKKGRKSMSSACDSQRRREHLANPMEDHAWIEKVARTIVVFCDAKNGAQDFNDSWTRRDRKVMESFLALVGILPEACWREVANDLYLKGRSSPEEGLLLTTLLVHHDPWFRVPLRWPDAPRIQLSDALRFIHERFELYRNVKNRSCPVGCLRAPTVGSLR